MIQRVRLPAVRIARPLALLAVLIAGPAFGVEPARDFLDGLRDRGYYDEALDYLDQMASSRLAPIELKESLLYEKAVTLIAASLTQRDPGLRESQLDDAQQLLGQFVKQHSGHTLATAAQSQLGNLIVERARMKSELASQGNKPQQLKEARALYEEAFGEFDKLQANLREQLERIPKSLDEDDPQQARMAERRDQLRMDYLQTQLLAAAIREETAETVKSGSKEATELLTESEKLYAGIHEKYGALLAGLYARLYQGRTNQKLGKAKLALEAYNDLLEQPESPDEFRTLRTKTLRLALESWTDQKNFGDAVKWAGPWVAKARPTEDRDPEWLALRLLLAKAYKMQADDPETKKPREALVEARRLAQFVSKYTSEFQKEAQDLVTQLGGPAVASERKEPKSFLEAKDAGRDALDAVQTAKLVVARVPARIAKEKDAEVKADLEEQLTEAQRTLLTSEEDALAYFKTALKLVDSETPLEEINVVRYFMAYLYYNAAQFYEAALTSEFVARRYPDSSGARPCAKIALASYLKLYGDNPSEEKPFETDRVVSIAEYIAERWSGQPEAEEALNTLVPLMINAGEYDRARGFLAKIPENSPKRVDAEMRLGQSMWSKYLRDAQTLNEQIKGGAAGPDADARQKELHALRSQVEEILAGAVAGLSDQPVGATAVSSVLSLAQLYVESQRADKAIDLLENAQYGVIPLLDKKAPSTQGPGVAEEGYKTALRAYIASLPTAANADETIEKAKGVMEKMRSAFGSTDGGQKRLVAIYVGLARDLEEQLAKATPEAKKSLSKGFETFLRQLSQGASELSVLNWVAETFLSLGSAFETPNAQLSPLSKTYYEQAVATFQKILDEADLAGPLRTQMILRQAEGLRRLREFKRALDSYEKILREKPMMLNVQVEAATAYQDWAKFPGKEALYYRAIFGHRPDPKTKRNIVWGWDKIASTTARFPQFKEDFNKARYNVADCRYRWALSRQGADQTKQLEAAERDIALTKRLYDLGGGEWERKYDALLRQIQKSKGERPTGLRALESDDKTDSATKSKP